MCPLECNQDVSYGLYSDADCQQRSSYPLQPTTCGTCGRQLVEDVTAASVRTLQVVYLALDDNCSQEGMDLFDVESTNTKLPNHSTGAHHAKKRKSQIFCDPVPVTLRDEMVDIVTLGDHVEVLGCIMSTVHISNEIGSSTMAVAGAAALAAAAAAANTGANASARMTTHSCRRRKRAIASYHIDHVTIVANAAPSMLSSLSASHHVLSALAARAMGWSWSLRLAQAAATSALGTTLAVCQYSSFNGSSSNSSRSDVDGSIGSSGSVVLALASLLSAAGAMAGAEPLHLMVVAASTEPAPRRVTLKMTELTTRHHVHSQGQPLGVTVAATMAKSDGGRDLVATAGSLLQVQSCGGGGSRYSSNLNTDGIEPEGDQDSKSFGTCGDGSDGGIGGGGIVVLPYLGALSRADQTRVARAMAEGEVLASVPSQLLAHKKQSAADMSLAAAGGGHVWRFPVTAAIWCVVEPSQPGASLLASGSSRSGGVGTAAVQKPLGELLPPAVVTVGTVDAVDLVLVHQQERPHHMSSSATSKYQHNTKATTTAVYADPLQGETGCVTTDTSALSVEQCAQLLRSVARFELEFEAEAKERLSRFYQASRRARARDAAPPTVPSIGRGASTDTGASGMHKGILRTMMKLAEAHARVCCRKVVTEEDVTVSIWLTEQSLAATTGHSVIGVRAYATDSGTSLINFPGHDLDDRLASFHDRVSLFCDNILGW